MQNTLQMLVFWAVSCPGGQDHLQMSEIHVNLVNFGETWRNLVISWKWDAKYLVNACVLGDKHMM